MYETVKIPITDEVKKMCWDYLKNHNLANRGIADGGSNEQYIGLIGEVMVYDYFFNVLPNLKQKKSGFDEGIDIVYKGFKIDVKTMGRTVYVKDYYVNNFYDFQKDYKLDILVFCSINRVESELEICGWIFKNELDQKAKFCKAGTMSPRADGSSLVLKYDTWNIENKNLYTIDNLIDYDEWALWDVCNSLKEKNE